MREKSLAVKIEKEKRNFLLVVVFFLLSGMIYTHRFESGSLEMGTRITAAEIGTREEAEVWNGKLNINAATAEELEFLSGIGESRAADIIAYREANGDFSRIEDIMQISGIGEKTFEKIKEQITVEEQGGL